MKTRIGSIFLLALLTLVSLSASQANATVYCNRPSDELLVNPGRPYSAVGYLNNGCTAFLIDANHIVAAAHCFVDPVTGRWQTGLRFYPNFHPDRVTADAARVPRADVIRAVVGSRAGESELGAGFDWGIALVDNWRDTVGLDLRPAYLSPIIPGYGTGLINPAYTRHKFPYDDNDVVTWDNMEWDDNNPGCHWVGPHGGMWAIVMRDAPLFDGVNRDTVGCNQRWGSGFRHENCSLTRVTDHVVIHNCNTVGGSSGSPVFYNRPGVGWVVIGVGHGGGPTDFAQSAPACTPDTPARRDNEAASVIRFRFAPRFASNVAVHRRADNTRATALFAVDGDMDKVVFRSRKGPSPTYSSEFGFWSSMGAPKPGAQLTRIAACSGDASSRPQVFVVADNARIYTRRYQSNGKWSPWSSFNIPRTATSVVDIDATHNASGRCMLLAVADNGNAYARTRTSDTTWGVWSTVSCGSYRRITGLNYKGIVWASMIDSAGQIWRTSLRESGWATRLRINNPAGITAWRDIDMTWDEAERGFMVAVPETADNLLRFVPLYGRDAWKWRHFTTHLWAPAATADQDAPNIQSVTASRWMEDAPGTTSPVVFATDDSGNIYFIEYTRIGTPRWILDWKSFYHQVIEYK